MLGTTLVNPEFPNYYTPVQMSPKEGAQHASAQLKMSVPDLMKFGWGGPINHLIHRHDVAEIRIPNSPSDRVIVVRRGGGYDTLAMPMSREWLPALATWWQKAKGDIVPEGQVLRDSLIFPDGRGIRYIYAPPSSSAYGASMSIRIMANTNDATTFTDLIGFGAITADVADFLKILIKAQTPFIISGASGAGKTTFLSAVVDQIFDNNSLSNVLLVERSHELAVRKKYPVFKWAENRDLTLEHLAEKATQMNVDWLCLGECTGKEALWVLKAYSQGIPVLSTLHAFSNAQAFKQLALYASENPMGGMIAETALSTLATLNMFSIQLSRETIMEKGTPVVIRGVREIAEITAVIADKPVLNVWWSRDDEKVLRFNPSAYSSVGVSTSHRIASQGLTIPDYSKSKGKAWKTR